MNKILRPPIEEVSPLTIYKDKMVELNAKCESGSANWISSGNIYKAIVDACSELTNHHCSFCDGFPLDVTSRRTIEHYFPRSEFKYKTYEWSNLFLCCDKCQSNANRIRPFKYTLKPDDINYSFGKYFWFDPSSGEICVFEYLNDDEKNAAIDYLHRYGINDERGRNFIRKKTYRQLTELIIEKNVNVDRDLEQYRFLVDILYQLKNQQNSF